MPIVFDSKKKTWDFKPDTQEEVDAFFSIGKTVVLQKLTEKFAAESFDEWLKISKKKMFEA
jgi:hypothetical protein